MQKNEEEKDDIENIHPDSKYDNWTIRSFDVKTKYEDIPQWMKMYAESSIDTHEFFKFDRFEYKELDDWQKMLLKLYREDLRKVIRYYEDYRVSLLREIMERTKREGEQVSSDGEVSNRHTVCVEQADRPTVSLENKQQLHTLLSLDNNLPIDNKTSQLSPRRLSPIATSPGDVLSPDNTLSPDDTSSPSNTLSPDVSTLGNLPSPTSVKFKRFGQRKVPTCRSHNEEDILKAVADHQNKRPEQGISSPTQQSGVDTDTTTSPDTIPPPDTTTLANNASPELGGTNSEVHSNESTGSFVLEHSLVGDFLSPKLERKWSRRKPRKKLQPSNFNTENVDQNNTNDFPSPKHFRSASTRHSTVCTDFPSPLLMRSSSDRPANRHSVHNAILRGVQYRESSVSSCNTLDSDESFLSRGSSKRSSSRSITSPKLKVKSEPGSNNVTVIPVSERKEKKLPKFLSRAASFGRKDKNKVKTNRLTDGRTYSSGRSDPRQSRKEAFLTGKEEVLPKETSV
ncbi:hypothetical protein ACHWQZ_G003492 [Mnemiopsis leidyi]